MAEELKQARLEADLRAASDQIERGEGISIHGKHGLAAFMDQIKYQSQARAPRDG